LIQVVTDPWDQIEVDAFLCPINTLGQFSAQYPASYIKSLSGLDLEAMLRPHTPIAIGAAYVTPAGAMRARNLIHVPSTERPNSQVLVEDIARCVAASIVACELRGFSSLAVPLIGAFENGIPAEEAARAIHSEFKAHRGERPNKILFVARSSDEIEVFELAIEGLP
jgi:O-acetyl-ADP-ribose deacetylase (regulator of RNase III)